MPVSLAKIRGAAVAAARVRSSDRTTQRTGVPWNQRVQNNSVAPISVRGMGILQRTTSNRAAVRLLSPRNQTLSPATVVVQRTAIKGQFVIYAKQQGIRVESPQFGVLKVAWGQFQTDGRSLEEFEAQFALEIAAAVTPVTLAAALSDDQLLEMLRGNAFFRLHWIMPGETVAAAAVRIGQDMAGRAGHYAEPLVFATPADAVAALRRWIQNHPDLVNPGDKVARTQVLAAVVPGLRFDRATQTLVNANITGLRVDDSKVNADSSLSIGHLYPV